MEKISLRFGDGEVHATLPGRIIKEIVPKAPLNLTNAEQLVILKNALQSPVNSLPLATLAQRKKKAVLVVSDNTRLAPSHLLLPPLIGEIEKGGVKPEGIKIVIGSGNHRQVTEKEKIRLVGTKIYENYHCLDAHEGSYTLVGMTARGTPVEVSEQVADADLKIFTGNIEVHRLAGFSGGVKACIGISSPRAIEWNHKLSQLGPFPLAKLRDNPVRTDLEDFARVLGVDFLLNVVTDEWGNIEAAFAGDSIEAHRRGTVAAQEKYFRPINRQADLVIVSAGGSPKDASLYQALKAIQNAAEAATTGGIIIAVASCREGLGDARFRQWLSEADSNQDIVNRGQKEFVLGGHKAVMLAKILQRNRVYLVSEMPAQIVESTGFIPFSSLQAAVDQALQQTTNPEVVLLPFGGVTVPNLVKEYAPVGG